MNCMFYEASAFQSDLSQWNVSSVTNMECMFAFAKGLIYNDFADEDRVEAGNEVD